MKKICILILLALLSLFGTSTWAAVPEGVWTMPEPQGLEFTTFTDDGTHYYLYNPVAKMFFSSGNSWCTQACLRTFAMEVWLQPATEEDAPAGSYDLCDNNVNNADRTTGTGNIFTDAGNSSWVDHGTQGNYSWAYEIVGDCVRLKNVAFIADKPEFAGMYLGWNGTFNMESVGGVTSGHLDPFSSTLRHLDPAAEGASVDWKAVTIDSYEAFVASDGYEAYAEGTKTYIASIGLKEAIEAAEAFNIDVTAALAVYSNKESSVADMAKAQADLTELIDIKKSLNAAIENYEAKGFTGTDAAKTVLNNPAATKAEVEKAHTDLDAAFIVWGSTQASVDNPVDMTVKIVNPRFDGNDLTTGWSTNFNANGAKENAEYWYMTYDTYQDIKGLPEGVYVLGVKAFYRAGDYGGDAEKHWLANDEESKYAKLYATAGEKTRETPIANVLSGAETEPTGENGEPAAGDVKVTYTDENGEKVSLFVPNNMTRVEYFMHTLGKYDNKLMFSVSKGQTVTIGVKKTVNITYDWSIFDDFSLTCYGAGAAAYQLMLDEALKDYGEVTIDEDIVYTESYLTAYKESLAGGKIATNQAEVDAIFGVIDGAYQLLQKNIELWQTWQKNLEDAYNKYATDEMFDNMLATGVLADYYEMDEAEDGGPGRETILAEHNLTNEQLKAEIACIAAMCEAIEKEAKANKELITFVDDNVKELCIANWDTDGDEELNKAEAAAVTDLGEVFKGNTNITSFNELNHFSGLISIGDNAFRGSGLTSISIPGSVTYIGDNAFRESGLTNVVVPDGVNTLKSCCFAGCPNLTSVTIGRGVTEYDGTAFIDNPNLTNIVVSSENAILDSRNNCNAVIRKSDNTLLTGCQSSIIPESVEKIGYYAFRGSIGLTQVILPANVSSIEHQAFNDCPNLTSVTVMSNTPPRVSDSSSFSNSASATLYVPAGCKSAYKSANYWKNFKEIVEINNITFSDSNVKALCVANWDTNNDKELSEVEASAVTDLGEVFKGNTNITSFNELNYFTGLMEIAANAFESCGALTSITIPNSVTYIGNGAFWASGLTSITIPKSVTSIGGGAFANCNNLTNIIVEEGNSRYDSRDNCNAIIISATNVLNFGCKNTTIPNSVTTIDWYAFIYCSGLTSITIPNSVTNIGSGAFYGCSNLTSVKVMSKNPPIIYDGGSFSNSANATLYVPTDCKSVYKAADYWKEFKEIIEPEPVEPEEPVATTEEVLKVEDVTANKEQTVSVDICLDNKKTDLTAYQFDLTLPAGITLAKNDKDKFQVTKTGRYEDESQSLSVSLLEENTYRIVSFSLSNGIIEGTAGAILNAVLAIDKNVADGTYEAKITNIIFTKADGKQLKLADAKFNIVVNSIVEGDANGDGEINVSDIVELVNYILGKAPAGFVFLAADLNGDGEVNVTDIVMVVNIIMAGNGSGARSIEGKADGLIDNDYLKLIGNEDGRMSLCLDNQGSYVASQFDLRLSDGQELKGITLNGNRMAGHHVNYTQMGAGLYRVIVYSLSNEAYKGQAGELLNFDIAGAGTVSIENILFVTVGQAEKRFASLQSMTTGVVTMKTLPSEKGQWFDLQGRRVADSAKKGVYINRGKKLVVR